jgi:Methylamine utilisation protein MauE
MPTIGHWAEGPYLAACALLAFAGIAKLARPLPARAAAQAIGLPASRLAVITLGLFELALGTLGAWYGGALAVAVAVTYLLLASTVVRLLRRAPGTPCGCLGGGESPPSRAHVWINVSAAACALLAAPAGRPLADLAGKPLTASVFAALVVLAVALTSLVTDALPSLDQEGAS